MVPSAAGHTGITGILRVSINHALRSRRFWSGHSGVHVVVRVLHNEAGILFGQAGT